MSLHTHTHTHAYIQTCYKQRSTSNTTCVLAGMWECSEGKHGEKNKKRKPGQRGEREVVIAVPNLCPSSYISASSSFSCLELQMSPQRDESRLLRFSFSSPWAVGNRLFLERQNHFQICAVMCVEVGAAGPPPVC